MNLSLGFSIKNSKSGAEPNLEPEFNLSVPSLELLNQDFTSENIFSPTIPALTDPAVGTEIV